MQTNIIMIETDNELAEAAAATTSLHIHGERLRTKANKRFTK